MLDLKKRLGALIPGDVRRARVADSFVLADVLSYRQLEVLQNVLTVEWSGHKTVLVEVPAPSGPSESNEVEMLGMSSSGRDNNNYGRLSDEDVCLPRIL